MARVGCLLAAVLPRGPAALGWTPNPIISDEPDLADPSVLEFNGTLYLYPTGDQSSYRVYHRSLSSPASPWLRGPTVFRGPGPCRIARVLAAGSPGPGVGGTLTWAPHVIHDARRQRFFLYYSVCLSLGVAVADSPLGPFEDRGVLVSWAIDAFVLQDPGEEAPGGGPGLYLFYSAIHPLRHFLGMGMSSIYGQRMRSPTELAGEAAVPLLRPSLPWEFNRTAWSDVRGVNEAPEVLRHGGTYYLMYSGALADSDTYRIGYATAGAPLGPYTKHEGPITRPPDPGRAGVFGPGHHSLWRDTQSGQLWAFYHQQRTAERGWSRFLCVDRVAISDSGLVSLNVTRGARGPEDPDAQPAAWKRAPAAVGGGTVSEL